MLVPVKMAGHSPFFTPLAPSLYSSNNLGWLLVLDAQVTRFDVYETLCPQQMLVHKGGQIKNWSGECKDIIPTKLQCQTIQRTLQSPNLQREIIRKK